MAFDAKIRLTSDTSKVDAGIAGVQRKIAGMSSRMGGAIAGMFSIGLIAAGIKNMMSFADEIQDGSERLGVTTKRFQELRSAAQLAGKDIGSFEKAFNNIETAAQAAVGGNSKAIASFKALGISEQQVKTMNKDDLLKTAVGNAAGMADRSNAQMLLGNIVGKKGAGEMLGMAENIVNPEGMGAGMVDDDTLNALADAEDQLTIFIERLKTEAMPILVTVGTAIMNFLIKMKQGFDVVVGYITGLFSNISESPAIKGLAKLFSGDIKGGLKDLGSIAANNMKANLMGVVDVVTGKKGIGEAIADTFKETASNVLGKDAVETAEQVAAETAQEAMDDDAKREARLAALRKARLDRQKQLAGDVNRMGTQGGKDKSISLGEAGGPSGVSYGNLIGVNSQYRLERLNIEQNEHLQEIINILKTGEGNSWVPPEQ